VVVADRAGVTRVVVPDAGAVALGIHEGMTLAEARALCGAGRPLGVRQQSPESDRAALENLAIWADRFSPCVHLEGEDTLLLDLGGCQRLFPDEDALLRQIITGLGERGYTTRGAMADTPGGAWALAHAHPCERIVAPPGQVIAALAPLPAAALRIDEGTVATLAALGVQTIEALLHLPRASLASRLGGALVHRLDQALGDAPELLTPFRARPLLKSGVCIGRATDRHDVLREALERVLAAFCEQLDQRVAGVRQLFVVFEGPPELRQRPVTLEVNTSRATRSAEHLRRLLLALLDDLRLPFGAAGVRLWARHVEPLDGVQQELFGTGESRAGEVAELVDRLAARLGSAAVVRPRPASDHQPEQAYAYEPATEGGEKSADRIENVELRIENEKQGIRKREGVRGKRKVRSEKSEPRIENEAGRAHRPFSILDSQFSLPASDFVKRPLRLLRRPVAVPVVVVVPEGPPSRFEWEKVREVVVDALGPERVETGWWRGRHVRRDYFRVLCASGRRCWLFRERETGGWYVHGWFD